MINTNLKISVFFSLLLVATSMPGCVPVAIMGTTAAVGTSMAEERGLKGVVSDTQIRADINMKWLNYDPRIHDHIEMTVREGRVLLAGHVPNPQMQIDAVRLAWQVNGVREVIDETDLEKDGGFSEYASDTWIITQIRSKLLFDGNIDSLNYTIKAINGVVYLMGIDQNQQELERVHNHARTINGVKKVVSHVRVKAQPLPSSTAGEPDVSHPDSDGFESAPPSTGVDVQPLAPPQSSPLYSDSPS